MSLYAVYDRATSKIVKTGIAANADECLLQADQPGTQGVVAAETPESLSSQITALGLK
jgi:hypothetical protein